MMYPAIWATAWNKAGTSRPAAAPLDLLDLVEEDALELELELEVVLEAWVLVLFTDETEEEEAEEEEEEEEDSLAEDRLAISSSSSS